MRVDAHHHLWRYTPQDYPWIEDSMQGLKRDFMPGDLEAAVAAAKIDTTIVVQARQSLQETLWLLELAARSPAISAVVGWAAIASPDFAVTLDVLTHNPLLKGLRHVVQAEPDGFLDDAAFNRGIDSLLPSGIVYEVLIKARQLPEAIRFVDRHPHQAFVLDHLGKPDIAGGEFGVWANDIEELARRDNVVCKLSGMVTEADWTRWTPDQLKPYFDTVLHAFSPRRMMFGSDWPVLTVACEYSRWVQTVEAWIAPLSSAEQNQIMGETATCTYLLTTSSNYQITTTS
jgi:L-fuconolactonase